MTSRSRPAAVIATPIHWRAPTLKPNIRSAITARITTPVESTAWTTESGAKASAATWKNQALVATAMPIANHLEENRSLTVRRGWRMSTFGASLAPRCLYRKPSCVTTAQASASKMPRFNMGSERCVSEAAGCGHYRPARCAVAPWPSRSLLSSVLKAPALRPFRLTSSHFGSAGCAAPLDRRRWCDLPFRLRTNRTSRGPLDLGRRHPSLPINGRRAAVVAALADFRVRLVHGLGGPRRGPPAGAARPPGRMGAPLVPAGAGDDRALEAGGDRGLRRPGAPGGVDRRRPRREL